MEGLLSFISITDVCVSPGDPIISLLVFIIGSEALGAIHIPLTGDISLNLGPASRSLNGCFLNIRPIRNKSASFLEFVKDNNADLIAVTETWLRPEDTEGFISSITPPGYKFTHVPRNVKKGGRVGFSSRRTCVLSKFQKTIVRLLKVP